ncbi:MAG TPA: prolipoprotein diacylglyceryl transferase [Myxococcales bacterium]|nr:prolipoprotein diacylglyceryl transferase [Myxococcales bacterium]
MLPILFTLTIPVSLGIVAWLAASLVSGLWQYRTARAAGDDSAAAWKACGVWTVGTAAVLFVLVKLLGGQNITHLTAPLAVPVHTYGILVAGGFLVAMQMAARAAERSGLSRDKVLDLSFGILVAAMIGSRVLFIIVNWDEFKNDLPGIFEFWKGGLVFYGGFIGAVAFSIWYMRKHQMAFFSYADAMAPTVAIGQALGRLGCFSAGCCWGGACDVHYALAARFPPDSLAFQSQATAHVIAANAASTIPIHPTQLYEAFGCALIFLGLTLWRTRKSFNGELLALYLMLYAPLRAVVETFRGDEERGRVFNFLGTVARHAWWNLSTSELISVGIFAAGAAIYAIQSRKARLSADFDAAPLAA